MDAIRKFFANFRRHGTISITPVNKVKIIATNIKKTSPQAELKSTLEAETTALEPNKGPTASDEVLKIPRSNLHDVNTAANINNDGDNDASEFIKEFDEIMPEINEDNLNNDGDDDTSECLKEFDEIMQEINADIPIDQVSLDEIDDVLNNINEQDKLKENESLQLEIPRFDLQDLIQSFDPNHNVEVGVDYMEINEPNSLDICNEPISDLDNDAHMEISYESLYLENDINVHNSLYMHDNTIEESIFLNDKFLNSLEDDVISISSDESQALDENETNKSKVTKESENVNTENKEINEPKNVNEGTNDGPRNVDSENKETNEAKNSIDKSEGINNKPINMNNDNKEINEVVNINYENEGINDEPRHMNNEIKETIESKTTTIECNEIKNYINNENNELNDPATKYVTFIDGSDDDCGYHSSDFEFITEEEAKMDGLIIHINPKMLKRKVTRTKRVKTMEISVDQFFGNNKLSLNKIDRVPCNMQVNGPGGNSFDPGSSNPARLDQNNVGTGDEVRPNGIEKNGSEWNNFGPGPSNRQENHPNISKLRCSQTYMPGNDPSYGLASNLQANGSSTNASHSSLRTYRRIPRKNTNTSNSMHNPEGPRPIYISLQAQTNVEFSQTYMQESDSVPKVYNRNGHGPTIQINCTATCNSLQISHSETSNMHEIVPGINNYISEPSNMQDVLAKNTVVSGPSNMQENCLGIDNFSPGPCNYLQADNFVTEPRMQENDPGINNYGPGSSCMHGNGPGSNNFDKVPRNMPENGLSPVQGNVSDPSDPSIEKWRGYQLRNRLNRRQFVPDYNYRENHRIIEGEPYYRLFDPSFGPLPNHRTMRLLENKSTLSKNTMLVAYQGLGFDMQMLRECEENEDENVKDADESFKKICEMYPGENRKKRRRF